MKSDQRYVRFLKALCCPAPRLRSAWRASRDRYGRMYMALGILMALGTLHCSKPTSDGDNPVLSVIPAVLDFGETSTSLFLTVSNAGSGALHWSIEVPSEGWISVGQREGNITNEPVAVDVRIDRSKAPVGQQEVTLVVTAERGGREEITLRATIRRAAVLSLSPTTLSFGETAGQQQVTIRNDGGETLTWNAASVQTWVSIVPSSGTLEPGNQQTVTIGIDRAGQPSGSIQGTVDVTSSGGSVSVILQATVPTMPIPSVSPATLDFGSVETRLTVELRNIGGATLDWTLEVSDAWVRPTTMSGSVLVGDARRIFIEVSREGLAAGAYQGSMTFRSEGGDVAVDVFLRVSAEPVLALSDESLKVGTETSFAFSILNTGSGDLHWDITAREDWLELDPVSGTTAAVPQTISGFIVREGLQAGTYTTTIRIASDGGEEDVSLTMEVPLPSVEIASGPGESEVLLADRVTFEFRAGDAYGDTEYSTRLDDDDWSPWSGAAEVIYEHLEESSLVGVHLLQVRVRADAGEAEEVLLRRFEVDAVQGPALRLSPKAVATRVGETIGLDIVVEEIPNMLAARVILTFDGDKLELQRVEVLDAFLSQHGGAIVQPEAEIDPVNGRLDLSIGVAGGTQVGVSGTGALARLHFQAIASGATQVSPDVGTAVRDPDNRPISASTLGAIVTIR